MFVQYWPKLVASKAKDKLLSLNVLVRRLFN